MQWFYASNNQRQGPVSEADFERLVREGVIQPSTLVWRQGMGNWQKYEEIAPSLAPPLPITAPELPIGSPAPSVPSTTGETAVCLMSGKRFPKRDMVEYQGKWVSAEQREAFFQLIREGAPLPGQMRYGGFWLRFVAKIIDGAILFACGMIVTLAFGVGSMGANPLAMMSDPVALHAFLHHQLFLTAINWVVGIVYDCFFIRRFSATPGKLALGLKLVRSDGSQLGVGRIIGRYFAEKVSKILFFIGYIIAAFDDEKRALHDYMCDTRVIKSR